MRLFKISKSSKRLLDAKTLKLIEERGEVKVKINKDDELEIEANDEDKGGNEWIAEQVLKAIVYGFESKQAFKLFDDQYFIEIIDLDAAFRRKEKDITRAKSRIIGEGGKARKKLEELSGTSIMVSNSTNNVSIIGPFEDLQNAKEAIIRLVEGAAHEGVYRFLESKRERVL
ncbi:MAG: KH domain-containing protein [Candidatus Micrarchaeota archaeon]|nr:KH domain-containing protein [Candidatus Micrarchaeota archaeon]